MERIQITGPQSIEEAAARAALVLRRGGVVLYPTDTIYGLGADAFSDEAVAKIQRIKGRNEEKPISCMVASLHHIKQHVVVDRRAERLVEAFLPGALTLVLPKRDGFEGGVARGVRGVGIRIPDHAYCLALGRAYGAPITATSANRSGEVVHATIDAILVQLGEDAALIDLVIDEGELPPSSASTVADLSGGDVAILREGPISGIDLLRAIQSL